MDEGYIEKIKEIEQEPTLSQKISKVDYSLKDLLNYLNDGDVEITHTQKQILISKIKRFEISLNKYNKKKICSKCKTSLLGKHERKCWFCELKDKHKGKGIKVDERPWNELGGQL